MDGFISRNGLVAVFFLGLMMFAISNLVGSEGEDGLLMKAASDFTGGSDAAADEANNEEPVRTEAPVPAPARPAQPATPSEFYDDAELVDTAAGYDPSPEAGQTTKSELGADEAMILPEPSVPQTGGGEPEAGMLVGNGSIVGAGSYDDDE